MDASAVQAVSIAGRRGRRRGIGVKIGVLSGLIAAGLLGGCASDPGGENAQTLAMWPSDNGMRAYESSAAGVPPAQHPLSPEAAATWQGQPMRLRADLPLRGKPGGLAVVRQVLPQGSWVRLDRPEGIYWRVTTPDDAGWLLVSELFP